MKAGVLGVNGNILNRWGHITQFENILQFLPRGVKLQKFDTQTIYAKKNERRMVKTFASNHIFYDYEIIFLNRFFYDKNNVIFNL